MKHIAAGFKPFPMHPVSLLVMVLALLLTVAGPAHAESRSGGNMITVTNNLDETTNGNGCSLREAITNSNDNAATYPDCSAGAGIDTIQFSIGAGGLQIIHALYGGFPFVSDPVTIDGTTQPVCSSHCIVLEGDTACSLDSKASRAALPQPQVPPAGGCSVALGLGAGDSTIRGLVIGDFSEGIDIFSDNNEITDNYIGTDFTGTLARPNSVGIVITGDNNFVQGNLISANWTDGMTIYGFGNVMTGNRIGTDATGKHQLGNGDDGIDICDCFAHSVNSSGNSIGTGLPGSDNVIAYNGGNGITIGLFKTEVKTTRNTIIGNRIYRNEGLGIDLGHDGITLNDNNDTDSGANTLQNYPVIRSAVTATRTIKGKLKSVPNASFLVQLYVGACDDTGYGEGKKLIATIQVTTNGAGGAGFTVKSAKKFQAGQGITVTATDATGSTSEFSKCKAAS